MGGGKQDDGAKAVAATDRLRRLGVEAPSKSGSTRRWLTIRTEIDMVAACRRTARMKPKQPQHSPGFRRLENTGNYIGRFL